MRRHKESGFAVVLMVALLAAIVLLLVGLAALTRNELRASAQQEAAERARANALVGLRVALGRLQTAAGPDARRTAQARLLGASANPYWTGVWGGAGGPVWLVSGNVGGPERVVATTGAGAEGAVLVGEKTAGVAGGCVAPWENLTTDGWPGLAGPVPVGRFAYWVGDEGVKGNVVVVDRVDEVPLPVLPGADDPVVDAQSRARLRQLATPRAGADALNFGEPATSGFLLGPESDAESAERWAALAQVLSFEQLRFVEPRDGGAQYRAFLRGSYHDLTVHSRGLLVDAERGGLRRNFSDLSAPDLPAAVRDLERQRPAGGRLPVAAGTAGPGEAAAQVKPLLTEWALDFVPYREDGGERVLVGCRLRLELWNPHALPLAHTPVGEADYRLRVEGLPVVRVGGPAGGGEFSLGGLLGGSGEIVVDFPGDLGGGAVGVLDVVVAEAWDSGVRLEDPTPADAGDDVLRSETLPDAARRLRLTLLTAGGDVLTELAGLPCAEFLRTSPAGGWSVPGNRAFGAPDPLERLGVRYHARLDPGRAEWRDWVAPTPPAAPPADLRAAECAFAEGNWAFADTDPAECARHWRACFDAGELFAEGRSRVVADFTVQRNLSIAALGRLAVPGERIWGVGHPWGGARNTVFDRAFFNPVPAGWRHGDLLPQSRHRVEPSATGVVPDAGQLGGWSAAAWLSVDGMFNVNSVSAVAWVSVLGRGIVGWQYGRGGRADLENPFFVLAQSAQHLGGANRGVRTFSDARIRELATAVAGRISARGRPFRSLAEFVDSGVLESAIADAGLNTTRDGWADLGAAPEPWSADWLTQASVLNTLAPILSVRSDTFTIRVAAEALNPALAVDDPERVRARAWCEAVVQRYPEFVDAAEAADTWPVLVAENAALGRRFRIVSFRWLGPDDL